jgi:hypothetical protein
LLWIFENRFEPELEGKLAAGKIFPALKLLLKLLWTKLLSITGGLLSET